MRLYLLHFGDVPDEGGVVGKVVQLLQLAEVLHVILPDDLRQTVKKTVRLHILRKSTVGEGQLGDVCSSLSCWHAERFVQTSAMSSARPGLQSSSQRLGVMPLVLF